MKHSNHFKPNENVIRVYSKPAQCPKCGSERIAYYQYGDPRFTEKLQKEIEVGKIVLGGCCIGIDDPFCVCTKCKTDFYKPIPPNGFPKPVEIVGYD